jgi:hypothetical protein
MSYDPIRILAREYSSDLTPSCSEPPLKPVLCKRQRQRPTGGSRLGVDTRVGLSPRLQVRLAVLPEGICGEWVSRQRRRAGMSRSGAWRAPGAGLGWGSVAGSGEAGSDDHGERRIAVTDGSRESQPSGRELLPDLPPRTLVLGGLPIAPQLAVGDGALGFRADLREVFPVTRQPRGQVHQSTSRPTKHGATLCLRTQVKCDKPICHNELRSISKMSQAVFIRSQFRSQPAPPETSLLQTPPSTAHRRLTPGR